MFVFFIVIIYFALLASSVFSQSCTPTECDTHDYYGSWEYYCQANDKWQHRLFYDYSCLSGVCGVDAVHQIYTGDQLVQQNNVDCQRVDFQMLNMVITQGDANGNGKVDIGANTQISFSLNNIGTFQSQNIIVKFSSITPGVVIVDNFPAQGTPPAQLPTKSFLVGAINAGSQVTIGPLQFVAQTSPDITQAVFSVMYTYRYYNDQGQAIDLQRTGMYSVSLEGSETSTDPDMTLLNRYAPILVMNPNEQYLPRSVESMIGQSSLSKMEIGIQNTQLIPPYQVTIQDLDGKNNLTYLDLENHYIGDWAIFASLLNSGYIDWTTNPNVFDTFQHRIYGRVDRRNAAHPVLQYWIFYPFNNLKSDQYQTNIKNLYSILNAIGVPNILQRLLFIAFFSTPQHEGDWEVLQVVLDNNQQPVQLTLSQQFTLSKTYAWSALNKFRETHPQVYVALGDHTMYIDGQSSFNKEFGLEVENILIKGGKALINENSYPLSSSELAEVTSQNPQNAVPYQLEKIDSAAPSQPWMRFAGRWGFSVAIRISPPYLNAGSIVTKGGPFGPMFQGFRWDNPLGWAAESEKNLAEQILATLPQFSQYANTPYTAAIADCPIDLHAYDRQDRHIGINSVGGIDVQIPGSAIFLPSNNDTHIILIFSNDSITFKENATANGTFNLTLFKYDSAKNTSIVSDYSEIPIASTTIASVTASSSATDLLLKIDQNGDGITDSIRQPDVLNCTGNCTTFFFIMPSSDSWTESLTGWKVSTKDILQLSKDHTVGNFSVNATNVNVQNNGDRKTLDLTLALPQPLNRTIVQDIHFWVKESSGTANITLYLNSGAAINSSVMQYSIPGHAGNWMEFKIPLSQFSGAALSIDLSTIQSITIRGQQPSNKTFSIFVDDLSLTLLESQPLPPLKETTISFWHFDESKQSNIAADSGSAKIAGTVIGNSSVVSGKVGKARHFTGSGYVLLGDKQVLRPDNLIVQSWVKTTSTASMGVFTTGRVQLGNNQYGFALTVSNGKPSVESGIGTSAAPSVVSPISIADGKWHLLKASYTRQNPDKPSPNKPFTLALWVDGVSKGTIEGAAPIAYYSGYKESAIAARKYGSKTDWKFIGTVDETEVRTLS